MDTRISRPWNRREFLGGVSAIGAGLAGLYPTYSWAEPPPETTTLSIVFDPNIPILCYGPQYVAKQLLHLEGFTDIRYAAMKETSDAKSVSSGEADISTTWAGDFVMAADRRESIVALSGMHIGCTEVFGGERVRALTDLKGKKVALYALNSVEHIWFSSMVAYIGLDPEQDIEWVIHPYNDWARLLTEGEVDAVMMWPPDSQIFREKNIGHVIMNTTTDRPWRNYFCCVVTGNREFVANNPIATKRALRAFMKATDMCALQPEKAAQSIVDVGFPVTYERALKVFREIPYSPWREYDPADTLRFYALRLRDLDMVKQTPESILEGATDWRFLNELKRELKA